MKRAAAVAAAAEPRRRSGRTAGKRPEKRPRTDEEPRTALDLFASATPKGRLNIVTPPLLAELFGGDERYKVYSDVDVKGDCFYDCMCKAHNSQQDTADCITVETLRARMAEAVTADTFELRRALVVEDTAGHDPDKAELYEQLDMATFKQVMQTRDYYASTSDVLAVIGVLGLTPIVLNQLYGTKVRVVGSERMALQAHPVLPYMREGKVIPKFVLLYRRGEHFQLVVRTDRRLLGPDGSPATIDGRIVYNAVFGIDDLPLKLLMVAGMVPHLGDEVGADKRV